MPRRKPAKKRSPPRRSLKINRELIEQALLEAQLAREQAAQSIAEMRRLRILMQALRDELQVERHRK